MLAMISAEELPRLVRTRGVPAAFELIFRGFR
jgi:hypothetical protein